MDALIRFQNRCVVVPFQSVRLALLIRLALSGLAIPGLAVPASAIIGGQNLPPADHAVVMVLSDRGSVCSGVIIAPQAVLTAAHCVTGASAYRVHWRDSSGMPVMEEPKRIAVHPDYHPDAIANRTRSIDLAIIQTAQPLPPSFGIASLPAPNRSAPSRDTVLTIKGFGLTSEVRPESIGTLHRINLPVVTPYGQGKLLVWLAGKANQGACTGDSGGGIFDDDGLLVAVTVWSEGKKDNSTRCGAMTQGVLTAPHRNWIDKTLKR